MQSSCVWKLHNKYQKISPDYRNDFGSCVSVHQLLPLCIIIIILMWGKKHLNQAPCLPTTGANQGSNEGWIRKVSFPF